MVERETKMNEPWGYSDKTYWMRFIPVIALGTFVLVIAILLIVFIISNPELLCL